jgi:hypothetical protein
VQVQGPAEDLDRLAGEWQGEYIGDPSHARRGTIAFKLVAGAAHAQGDVVMTPQGAAAPYGRFVDRSGDRTPVEPRQTTPEPILTIKLVLANGRMVSGSLDPYWDPDRSTQATTTFVGTLVDDTVEGTFVTEYASRAPSTSGTWKVTRSRR